VSPVKPVVPGVTPATTVVAPAPPHPLGNVPLKPVSSTPASILQPSSKKTGTAVVKTAPPKETARITVKPNLPPAAVRAGGNFPTAKPAAGAVPVAAAAAAVAGTAVAVKASTTPATTVVKTGAATARVAIAKPALGTAAPAVVAAPSTQFQEEEASTVLTTVLAGVLAVLTWGTAAILIASYLAWI